MSSITEEQLLDLSAETTAMIASYAAMVVVVKGTKPSARVELYSVKVNALIAVYRAEVAAREKAESEREKLRVMLERVTYSLEVYSKGRDNISNAARALLARLKDGGV